MARDYICYPFTSLTFERLAEIQTAAHLLGWLTKVSPVGGGMYRAEIMIPLRPDWDVGTDSTVTIEKIEGPDA